MDSKRLTTDIPRPRPQGYHDGPVLRPVGLNQQDKGFVPHGPKPTPPHSARIVICTTRCARATNNRRLWPRLPRLSPRILQRWRLRLRGSPRAPKSTPREPRHARLRPAFGRCLVDAQRREGMPSRAILRPLRSSCPPASQGDTRARGTICCVPAIASAASWHKMLCPAAGNTRNIREGGPVLA